MDLPTKRFQFARFEKLFHSHQRLWFATINWKASCVLLRNVCYVLFGKNVPAKQCSVCFILWTLLWQKSERRGPRSSKPHIDQINLCNLFKFYCDLFASNSWKPQSVCFVPINQTSTKPVPRRDLTIHNWLSLNLSQSYKIIILIFRVDCRRRFYKHNIKSSRRSHGWSDPHRNRRRQSSPRLP